MEILHKVNAPKTSINAIRRITAFAVYKIIIILSKDFVLLIGQAKKGSSKEVKKDRIEAVFRQGSHWSHTAIIIGWFSGLILIFYLFPLTAMSYEVLFRYLLFFALIGLVVPYRWYMRLLKVERLELRLLSVAGAGPFLTGMLLLLNFVFAGPGQTVVCHDVFARKVEHPLYADLLEIKCLNKAVYPSFLRLREDDLPGRFGLVKVAHTYSFEIAPGLFGYDVLKARYLETDHGPIAF